MHIIAKWLTGRGVSDGIAGLLSWVLPLVVLFGVIWWARADAYSDAVKATDTKWEKAFEKAKEEFAKGALTASQASDKRKEEFHNAVEAQVKEIEDAEAKGSSPFDVMFGK